MKLIKNMLFICFLFLVTSCLNIIGTDKSIVCFKLLNNTGSEIDWVHVYLQDTKDEALKDKDELIDFYKFENIIASEEKDSKPIDIEDFSKTGFGYYVVKIKFKNESDTLMPFGTEKYKKFNLINDIRFMGTHTSNTNIKIESKSKATVYIASN